MREAIERVIAELEAAQRFAKSIGSSRCYGMAQAYGVAVHKLREALESDKVPRQTNHD